MNFILFADDTNLFHSDKDLVELMNVVNVELINLFKWFEVNKLSLKCEKTNYILYGYRHQNNKNLTLNLFMDCFSINRVEYIKFLGVFIDHKLNWKKHIDHVKLKIFKGLGIMSLLITLATKAVLNVRSFELVFVKPH